MNLRLRHWVSLLSVLTTFVAPLARGQSTIITLAGLPSSSGSVDGGGNAARFNSPTGVAIDAAGNVYVAESVNNTLRKITALGDVITLPGTAGRTREHGWHQQRGPFQPELRNGMATKGHKERRARLLTAQRTG